jgi:yecA family protein
MTGTDTINQLAAALKACRRKVLPMDQVHGLLTAAVCGPTVVRPTRWLPYLFPATRDYESLVRKPAFEDALGSLVAVYDDILFTIRQGTFTPYFGPEAPRQPGLDDARGWCTGFLYGITLHDDAWRNADNEHLAMLTAPIFYIAHPESMTEEMEEGERAQLEQRAPALVSALSHNIPAIYDYWNLGRKPEEKRDFFGPESDT